MELENETKNQQPPGFDRGADKPRGKFPAEAKKRCRKLAWRIKQQLLR
jgi:hypothetical protein